MALNYILLEDGSGHILLEDSSGSILLENQPASSSIVFTPTGLLRGSARLGSGSSTIVFNVSSKHLCFTLRPFDPTSSSSVSPVVSNIVGLGSLFATSTYISPNPPFPENQDC